jgi:CBS domain-containing protein
MITVITALIFFGFVLAALVVLRMRSGNRVDIRNSDIVLALVPVALWLFLTGKVQEFTFGDVKIVAAIKLASKAPVGPEVSKLTVDAIRDQVRTMTKAGPEVIPQMINNKSQALSFTLGQGGYVGEAIADYFDKLTHYPFLKYVVMNNPDGTFFGIADARQIASIVGAPSGEFTAMNVADWLNGANKDALEALPGFIPSAKALHKSDNKQKALEMMNSLDVQILPVVDEAGRFDGVVDRSKLTASMLTEIAQHLEKSE